MKRLSKEGLYLNRNTGGKAMERRKQYLVAGLLIVSLAFGAYAFPGSAAAAKAQEVTVTGEVVNGVADGETAFVPVYIRTDDQGNYEVSTKMKGKELPKFIGKKITVTGLVKEKKDGKTITVTEYKVLE